jgi:gamma-glutamylputrescine oxidase
VIAGGGYLSQLVPALERAILPIATYVMTTEPLGDALHALVPSHAAIYDTRFAFDYYRKLNDSRLLWGGRISIRDRSAQDIARFLKQDMVKVFPALKDARVEHAWGGMMSYARHKMPQIGRLPNGLWYGLGFGGHGVAPTTAAGELLADAIALKAPLPDGFERYGLPRTFRPAGLLAAQATYSWLQLKDAWRERRNVRTT